MMRMVGVWVLVVMPHEPKAWHSERGQEEPHETQAPEPSNICVYNPPSHRTASLQRSLTSDGARRARTTG
jgi:hypothetical protein